MRKVTRKTDSDNATTELPLALLTFDRDVQQREHLSERTVDDYAARLRDGETFPSLVVFTDGETHWVADGFHRGEAARRAGIDAVAVDIRRGTKRDAVFFGAGANRTHGLQITNRDKRRAVHTLLADAEWAKWSDRQIARHVGVSHPFVAGLRRELQSGNGYHPRLPGQRFADEVTLDFELPELDGRSWSGLALDVAAGVPSGLVYVVPFERGPGCYWLRVVTNDDDDYPTQHTKKPVRREFVALQLDSLLQSSGWHSAEIRWSEDRLRVVEADRAEKVRTGNWFGRVVEADREQVSQ